MAPDIHSENAFARARRDFHDLATNTVRFVLWLAGLGIVSGAIGLALSAGHGTGWAVFVTTVSAVAGVAAVFVVPFAWLWAVAPTRQRDEARQELALRDAMTLEQPTLVAEIQFNRAMMRIRVVNAGASDITRPTLNLLFPAAWRIAETLGTGGPILGSQWGRAPSDESLLLDDQEVPTALLALRDPEPYEPQIARLFFFHVQTAPGIYPISLRIPRHMPQPAGGIVTFEAASGLATFEPRAL